MLDTALRATLNHLIGQHDWARVRLKAHTGCQVGIRVAGVSQRFRIDDTGLLGGETSDDADDVMIDVPAQAIASLTDGIEGVLAHARISGQAELAETVGFVARHLDWDREADLARLFGPIAGRRLHLTARHVEQAIPASAMRLARNTSEYLVHEGRWLADRTAFDDHVAQLRHLRDDLARLDQRVARLDRNESKR
ncbi:hypothetical protein G3580_01140 [Nitrogeniibacter mangrovi]|uniref:Ubiquinone biosynthesis accessory factor UbiJ n=1 Tax=Nitrogeniibacter mangrovi TaxID=2016596 RepID=A0A6C1AYY1_9RHOO|nr:hypothetical protein [Nitrogeniibacter mangrovi]QID16353.1 hypothetical protein G3580_01140 [Nitrogeniibacter mangrovi]